MLEAGIGDEQEKRKEGGMMTRTEKEKMLAGELYNAGAPELQAEMAITYKWLARYNAALGASASDLRELLLERLATVGERAMIRPPFHCDYGFNISLGGNRPDVNGAVADGLPSSLGHQHRINNKLRFVPAFKVNGNSSNATCRDYENAAVPRRRTCQRNSIRR